jgi:putative SOS response-associated peptidase YedK
MHLMADEPQVTLEAYPISTKVNSVRNNGPDLIAPIPPAGDLLFT